MSLVLQILGAGMGFMSDSYDIFNINMVVSILSTLTPLSTTAKTLIVVSTILGSIVGQVAFGWLSDYMGRQPSLILTATCIVLALVGCSSTMLPSSAIGIFMLCLFRFLLGVAVGAEYPLSSTFIAEKAKDPDNRGRYIAAVFSMQGIGAFLATFVSWLLLRFSSLPLNTIWRLILIFGAAPTLCALVLRIRNYCSKKGDNSKELKDDRTPVPWARVSPQVWKRFAGTSSNWFLLDIVFYGNSLLSSSLVKLFVANQTLSNVAAYTCLLTAIALPGYWFAIWAIDFSPIGRRWLQLGGFVGLLIVYSILAGVYDDLVDTQSHWAIVLYAFTFFLSNAGPNTTTFVLPAEFFPTRLRGRFHGMSAASGKIGALIGTYAVAQLLVIDPRYVFVTCAIISGIGIGTTFFLTEETKGVPLTEYEVDEDRGIPLPTEDSPFIQHSTNA